MLEWLKTILGEAYTEEIDKQVSAEIGKAFVSKADFNTVNKTKKELEDTISAINAQSGDNLTLQKTIKEHEATIANLQKENEDAKKTYVIREQLRAMGVADPDYIIFKQGGIEKFEFDKDGKAQKLDEIMKPYKENSAMKHLFVPSQQDYSPAGGQLAVKNPFAKDTFNLTEQGKMFKENPAQAKEMAAAAGINI